MVNPIKSVFTTFFCWCLSRHERQRLNSTAPPPSEELDAAKIELEKFILHHPVAVFIKLDNAKEEAKDDEAIAILAKDFGENNIGVLDVGTYSNPQEMEHAVSIRAYDRNNNHRITYPQIYIQGSHVGNLKELEKRKEAADWPQLVASVKEGPASKDEPSAL